MELSIKNEPDIDQAREESEEAKELLALDNHDTRPSFAVWSSWRRQGPISHTHNNQQTPYNTQVTVPTQDTGAGQAGVLNLQTMQWTPLEINHGTGVEHEMPRGLEAAQQSANAEETRTKNEEMLPKFASSTKSFQGRVKVQKYRLLAPLLLLKRDGGTEKRER